MSLFLKRKGQPQCCGSEKLETDPGSEKNSLRIRIQTVLIPIQVKTLGTGKDPVPDKKRFSTRKIFKFDL